ncbi:MAG: hypothetical protein RLZZ282_1461, partial [Verrucomicrobiota bacterium]
MGLPPTEPQALQRALAYRDVIASTLRDGVFYARSYRCAPLATARLLLSWRDNLSDAGWHADDDHGDAPARLQILAGLESAFRDTGLAETTHAGRIAAILGELELGSQAAMVSLTVVDPPIIFPRCWTQLFSALNAHYDDSAPTAAVAEPSTTLGAIQANLLGKSPECPDDQNSVRIITAATPEAAADALACQLVRLDPASTTLIAEPSEREMLNRHFKGHDLPLPTAKQETAAALMDLPCLFLRCRLAPLDPQAWIEFLLHSISPIPSTLRRRLAENIHKIPGHGPHWEEALEDCIKKNIEDNEAITRLRNAFTDWIEAPLVAPDALTGPAIADVMAALAQWLSKRAGAKKSDDSADAAEWGIATRALAQLEALFRTEGVLTRIEIDKLLVEWRQTVSATTRFPGQVGAVTALACADQLLAPHDHIIWWRPAPSHTRRSPWTRGELEWLGSRDITLPDESAIALAAETSAIRAALLARKSLTFYHVTQSAGGPAEQAGILTRLLTWCGPSLMVAARDVIATQAIPLRPLPPLRRWWNLQQPDLLPARKNESFSSVSKIIDAPVDWVLDYHAKLSLGPIAGLRVSDDALRNGSIFHAAAELLFSQSSLNWQTATELELHQFLAVVMPGLLAAKAAHFLVSGHEAARTRLLHSAQQTLWHLIEILRDAEITVVTTEINIDPIPFVGGQIGGRIDLIARRADGKSAVIDLKLGGKSKR